MKFLFVFFISLVVVNVSIAQKADIVLQGLLKDSASGPLPSATIMLLSASDSSLVNFTSSNHDGFFTLRNVSRQSYLLKITYVGYKPVMKSLDLANSGAIHDIGLVRMEVQPAQLDEVQVIGQRDPIILKGDTIEYNATSFITKENAVVEDLLKKLPGVEVDTDGTIRAQGEQVRRVTVDGKNFFGDDPKIATRNLPADAIAKVQLYDKKSDQSAFTGIDDGQREKTINLELKEQKRKGAFGTLQAGVGDNERFQARSSVNKFRKDSQLSFLGMGNNINEQGFGMEEYMNFTGGAQQMMSGRGGAVRIEIGSDNQNGVPLAFGNRTSGLLTNYATGLNLNRQFNQKTELNSSYFYNHIDHEIESNLDRTNYLPGENRNYFTQSLMQANTNNNHRVNTVLDHKMDSVNSFKLTTNFTLNSTYVDEVSESKLMDEENLINWSTRSTYSEGSNVNFNSTLLWRHRFPKKGRTLSNSVQLIYSVADRSGIQNATLTNGENGQETRIIQSNDQTVSNLSYGNTLTYTEPLGGRKYLEANYTFRENRNDLSRIVNDVSGDRPQLNQALSNAYNSAYQFHRGGLNFRINRRNYNATLGGSLQQTFLDGTIESLLLKIKTSFQNVLPVFRFNYEFSNTKRVNFDYETSVQEPTIQQLQPVVDNSDPVNLYVGNPNLRPAYRQSLRVNFMSFNPGSHISFFSFVQAGLVNNAITVSQSFSNDGIRISKPVNVKENTFLTANTSLGFPIKKLGSRLNLSFNMNHQRGITIVNDVDNFSIQNTVGGRVRYEYRYMEVLDIALVANLNRQTAQYDANRQNDQLFFNHIYNVEGNLRLLKNYSLGSSLEYLSFENKTNDYVQAIPLFNLSVSRFLLKAKSGELKLSVVNLLDRNTGVSQTATLNYFERQQTNNLGRYFMISFIYALNKQLNPMGTRPAGGMIRIMR